MIQPKMTGNHHNMTKIVDLDMNYLHKQTKQIDVNQSIGWPDVSNTDRNELETSLTIL